MREREKTRTVRAVGWLTIGLWGLVTLWLVGCGTPMGSPSPTAPTATPGGLPSPGTTPTPAAGAMHGSLTATQVQALRQAVVDKINQDRASRGRPAVTLDSTASQVSDQFCALQMQEGTRGHFTTNGLKPYHRMGLAGSTDSNGENAAALWCPSGGGCFGATYDDVHQQLLDFEDQFFNETPPNDGHRQTILNARYTHVGVGFAFSNEGLRMTEEFLARYVTMSGFPMLTSRSGSVSVSGQVNNPSLYDVQAITVFYEVPVQRTVDEVNAIFSYGYPTESSARRDLFPGLDFTVGTGGAFTASIPLFAGAAGYYTVVVWLDDGSGSPFTATDAVIVAQ